LGQAFATFHVDLLRLEFLQARIQVGVVILLLLLQRIHRVLQHFVLTTQSCHFLTQTFQLVLHVELGPAALINTLRCRCLETIELVPQLDHRLARLVVIEHAGVRGTGCQQTTARDGGQPQQGGNASIHEELSVDQ
jgi:hypothetical protein